ncbi:hypothetical protein TSOC_009553, partial [Tetrabaena socialis]
PSRSVTASLGVGEFFRGFFDGSWAPRSTRMWRQGEYDYEASTDGGSSSGSSSADEADAAAGNAADISIDLQARLRSLPASARTPLGAADSADAADGSGYDGVSPATRSFSEAGDGDLAASLTRRIGEIASSTASYDSQLVAEEEARQPLSGVELRQLIFTKYGKNFDVSFVRRDIPGKTFVFLNIMWVHLGQRSFKLTEEQYMEKMEGAAYLVGALGQTDKVRAFLQEPARSQKGLPPRPVVGTAITIRFDLEPSVIAEWFGEGYQ